MRSGLNVLPQALAKELEVYLNHEVIEITQQQDHISVISKHRTFTCKKLVCALPANAAKKVLPKAFVKSHESLLSTTYASTMHLAYEFPHPLPESMKSIYGMMIGKRESSLINVISIENNKHLERKARSNLITVMLTSSGASKLQALNDQEVLLAIKAEVARLLPELRSALNDLELSRWDQAIPNHAPGYVRSVAKYRQELSAEQSIFLAGDYLGTPCVEGALESGLYVSRLFDAAPVGP